MVRNELKYAMLPSSSALHAGPIGVLSNTRQQNPNRHPVVALLLGLAEGWRAYQRWQALDSMSDRQLRRMGIDRRDTARCAMFGTEAV